MNENIDYEIPAYIRNLSPEQRADLEHELAGLIYGDEEGEEGESFDDFVATPVSEEERAKLEALWADHAAHVFEWDAAINLIPF